MAVRLLLCGLQPAANPETARAIRVEGNGAPLLLSPWRIAKKSAALSAILFEPHILFKNLLKNPSR